jgi:hypothetical protein
MNFKTRLTLPLVAVIVAVLVARLGPSPDPPVASDHRSVQGVLEEARSEPESVDWAPQLLDLAGPVPQEREEAAFGEPMVLVQVRDSTRSIRSDATLEVLAKGRIGVSRPLTRVEWDPNQLCFVVPASALDPRDGLTWTAIRARAGTSVSAAAALPQGADAPVPTLLTLVLQATYTHSVRVTFAGSRQPAADIPIALSAGSIPENLNLRLAATMRPGPSPVAVHAAVTGNDGIAKIEGLTAGTYSVCIQPPAPWAAVAGPAYGKVEVPGPETTFQIAPMVAAGVRVANGKLLTYNAKPLRLSFLNFNQGHIGAARKAAETRWPESAVMVGLNNSALAPRRADKQQDPEVAFRLLIDGIGWVERTVRCRTLDASWEPDVVDASTIAGEQAFATLRIRPAWDRREAIDPAHLPPLVYERGRRPPDLSIPVPWDTGVRIPCGKGSLCYADPWMRSAGSVSLDIPTGQTDVTVDMPLPANRVPVVCTVTDEFGEAVRDVTITATVGETRIAAFLPEAANAPLWLPTGFQTLGTSAPGFGPSTDPVEVTTPGASVRLILRAQ